MSMSEWVHVYGSRDHPRCCSTSFWDCFSLGPKPLELSFSWLTDESQWFLPHNSLSNTVDILLNGCQGLISGPYATRASITLVGQLLSSSFYSTLLFSALLSYLFYWIKWAPGLQFINLYLSWDFTRDNWSIICAVWKLNLLINRRGVITVS